MNVRQETTRAAILGALRGVIDGEYTHARGQTLEALLDARKNSDVPVKTVFVILPDGTKVATVTLVDKQDEIVVQDRSKFTEWVQARAPEKVIQEPSPLEAVKAAIASAFEGQGAAWSDDMSGDWLAHVAADAALAQLGIDTAQPPAKVNPKYESEILDEVKAFRGPDGGVDLIMPDTGEVVPGLEFRPGGDPDQFQMRYSTGGREAIAKAWRENRLPKIEGLPEISP